MGLPTTESFRSSRGHDIRGNISVKIFYLGRPVDLTMLALYILFLVTWNYWQSSPIDDNLFFSDMNLRIQSWFKFSSEELLVDPTMRSTLSEM